MSIRLLSILLVCFFVIPASALGQQPIDVSCQLAKSPKTYDKKLVRVRGTLNVYFEDFSLEIGNCDSHQGIWLAFGGDVPGIVTSTVNDISRKPGSNLTVDRIPVAINKDENFRRLYALIASRHGDKPNYRVTATLTGRFFAGVQGRNAQGGIHFWGYGHLGCCSLLIITQVSNVVSAPPANLNVRGVVTGPDGKPLEGVTVIDDVLGGSPPERQTAITDRRGRFAFADSGQQLRILNPSYRPLALTLRPGHSPVQVRLQDAKRSDWLVHACSAAVSGRAGFSVLYTVPSRMRASRFDSEGIRSFWVHRRGEDMSSGEMVIAHAPDRTLDGDNSVGSEWMTERWVRNAEGNVIGIDARGRSKRGGYFRSVTFSNGDTAGYSTHHRKNLRVLDQIIDSACIAKSWGN